MNRIFWRHAQAGWGHQDLARTLTEYGLIQAQDSADWLRAQGADYPIYSSQAQRTQQTAACYGEIRQTLPELNPDRDLPEVLAALAGIREENAIIVGHLPWIGEVIAHMLHLKSGYVPVDTAALFWLRGNADGWQLHARYPE